MSRRTDELICKAIIDELNYWRSMDDKIKSICGTDSTNDEIRFLEKGFKKGIDRAKIIVKKILINKDLTIQTTSVRI